jgi:hypothetical protein
MIENIIQLLEIAKQQNWRGDYIDIALGLNKYPESIREGFKQHKRGLWHKK